MYLNNVGNYQLYTEYSIGEWKREIWPNMEIKLWCLGWVSKDDWEVRRNKIYLREWAFLMPQMAKNLPAMRDPGFDPWVGKIPWRRAWQPTPVFLSGESHGQRRLADYSLWACKESDMTEWLSTTTI